MLNMRRLTREGLISLGLTLVTSQCGTWAQGSDQAALRQGVAEIAAPGLPERVRNYLRVFGLEEEGARNAASAERSMRVLRSLALVPR